MLDLARYAHQHRFARALFGFQALALRLLLGIDRGELGALLPRRAFEFVEPAEIRAQVADQLGARTRQVGEVMQLTRNPVRIIAVQKQFQRVRLGADVLLVEEPREPRLLAVDFSRRAAALAL